MDDVGENVLKGASRQVGRFGHTVVIRDKQHVHTKRGSLRKTSSFHRSPSHTQTHTRRTMKSLHAE